MKTEHLLMLGAAGAGVYFWMNYARGASTTLTRGSATLRTSVPYRFTYQTTTPLVATPMNATMVDRQNKVRLLLVPARASDVQFGMEPGLQGGEYLMAFTAMPIYDSLVTIGMSLTLTGDISPGATPYSFRLRRVQRLDGIPI